MSQNLRIVAWVLQVLMIHQMAFPRYSNAFMLQMLKPDQPNGYVPASQVKAFRFCNFENFKFSLIHWGVPFVEFPPLPLLVYRKLIITPFLIPYNATPYVSYMNIITPSQRKKKSSHDELKMLSFHQ